ncbi:MAG: fluoroquinolone resistance protein [Paraglaciecola sp.]|jgi:fluoroquinolone resistance protein
MPPKHSIKPSSYGQQFNDIVYAGTQLSGLCFEDCEFINCDFTDLLIENCIFTDCQFTSCNLSFVKLNGSQFVNVVFSACKLLGVNWTYACWQGLMSGAGLSFKHSILNSSSFFALYIAGIHIIECKAQDVDFREADLQAANFTGTDLRNTLFMHTNLSQANFTDATDYYIDLRNNVLTKARFSRYEALNLLTSMDIDLID